MKEPSGSEWSVIHDVMHSDHQAFLCNPNNPDEAIFGNDGGVYYSAQWSTPTDSLKNLKIQKRNYGYNVTQYYAVDLNPFKNNGTIAGGTQDNGTQSITAAYNIVGPAEEINGGDGAMTFIDKVDTNIVISSYTNISPRLHRKGAIKNFSANMTPGFSGKGQFINPAAYDSPNHTYYANYTYDPKNSDTLAVRYKITATSDTVTYKESYIKYSGEDIKVSFIKLSKTAGVMYLGTKNGEVYKISNIPLDGNATVAPIKIMSVASTGTGNVSCIDFGKDENTIIVTKSNYNVKSVFWTTNAGGEWVSKDEEKHGLPNIPIR